MIHPAEVKPAWNPHLLSLVDATGAKWDDGGMFFATRVSVLQNR